VEVEWCTSLSSSKPPLATAAPVLLFVEKMDHNPPAIALKNKKKKKKRKRKEKEKEKKDHIYCIWDRDKQREDKCGKKTIHK
jgi:hypothetical protein